MSQFEGIRIFGNISLQIATIMERFPRVEKLDNFTNTLGKYIHQTGLIQVSCPLPPFFLTVRSRQLPIKKRGQKGNKTELIPPGECTFPKVFCVFEIIRLINPWKTFHFMTNLKYKSPQSQFSSNCEYNTGHFFDFCDFCDQ